MAIPAGNYSVQGGKGGDAGPSTATNAVYGSGLDGSNWAVNFGSGSLSASSTQDKSDGQGVPGVTSSSMDPLQLAILAAAVLAVGALIWRSKASRR